MATGLLESIDRSSYLAGHNRLAMLLFHLGGDQFFGINVFKVAEVIESPKLSWFPSAHPFVKGLADIRGKIIPIIDLQKAIGGSESDNLTSSHIIVTEFNRHKQGFLVRSVDRIIHVRVEDVELPPDGGKNGFLTSVVRYHKDIVEIIDVERVLAEVIGDAKPVDDALMEKVRSYLITHPHACKKIMVVDDSKVARNQIYKMLIDLNLKPILFQNGREAYQELEKMKQDGVNIEKEFLMVISDIEMPDMDGYTLTSEIKKNTNFKSLYVVLHTSLSGVFNHAMVSRVGADQFIPKFNSDELAGSVFKRLISLYG